ncbi:MAG: Uma2 family endonuclease [Candidatus Brocadia sp.]|nr:Uma2 family endonuclease [Candidatus Brocadia sp.]UJS18847.1 MAG: Uma2 family endonuclease [Candidatus Jettenia sp.]
MVYPLIKKSARKYTWNDYLSWPDDERWEIIDGVAYNMTPAPTVKHQVIAGKFFSRLEQQLTNKPCRPFIAPVDVILTEYDIAQPDVFVVCDKNKITDKNIQGAPDFVIEILSPFTALKDLREKKQLYERCGVREYLVVDPLEEYIERFWLDADAMYTKGEIFGPHEVFSCKSLEGVEINLWEIFEVERLKE